jgi:vacuolar protein sorting-associated protein 13A/C
LLTSDFQQSDYAIINTDDPELPIEDHILVTDRENIPLTLRLHYLWVELMVRADISTYPNSGGAIRVQIYSPFVFLNKTTLPFDLSAKTWVGGQREVAGRADFADDHKKAEPTPFSKLLLNVGLIIVFNFPQSDRRDRLLLRVADAKWSKPMSFDSPAADMAVVMQSSRSEKEMHVGLSYSEGLGKVRLSTGMS